MVEWWKSVWSLTYSLLFLLLKYIQEEKMKHEKLLKRIVIDPKIMVGKPIIKGTRLTVQYIVGLLAEGTTIDEILEEYKGLKKEDIEACLLFASEALEDTAFMPLKA
jgi:uncharacterized protein (DUF433 family)